MNIDPNEIKMARTDDKIMDKNEEEEAEAMKDTQIVQITPLSIAIARGNFDLVQYLFSKGCKVTSDMFYLACKHSNQNVVTFVLDSLKSQGMSQGEIEKKVINGVYDKTRSTPLIRASQSGNLFMVKLLLDRYGADVAYRNKNDENCLMAAVRGK